MITRHHTEDLVVVAMKAWDAEMKRKDIAHSWPTVLTAVVQAVLAEHERRQGIERFWLVKDCLEGYSYAGAEDWVDRRHTREFQSHGEARIVANEIGAIVVRVTRRRRKR